MGISSDLSSAYGGVAEIVHRYWKNYGGFRAVCMSPYFHVAVLITFFLPPYWLKEQWWTVSLSVLPNIIGFALGGYAIWLGFGDEKFRKLISEQDDDAPSPYMEVSATFAHFIVVQICALLLALIAAGLSQHVAEYWWGRMLVTVGISPTIFSTILAPVGHAIGFFFLVYGLFVALAATLAVFRVASWFDVFRNGDSTSGGGSRP